MKRFVALSLGFSVLAGCVPALAPLPEFPRAPIDRMRARVTEAVAEKPEPVLEPTPGPPPAELTCTASKQDPGVWLCRGGGDRMGEGKGLFFAFGGSVEALAQRLKTERLLRELVGVLQERLQVRGQMELAMLEVLDTTVVMAEEYRMIAVLRGEEITRLQRDRLVDRFTMVLPGIGLIAIAVYAIAH